MSDDEARLGEIVDQIMSAARAPAVIDSLHTAVTERIAAVEKMVDAAKSQLGPDATAAAKGYIVAAKTALNRTLQDLGAAMTRHDSARETEPRDSATEPGRTGDPAPETSTGGSGEAADGGGSTESGS